eukprot:gnl/Trimastix_PCT/1778.p1 GENE.gnl/Trimastix_PCT/1778~~gnl/Trimastix_PCT/1778.p1  ORF type:complete len:453 (+),score=94.41 gnl/Trimastix_PCT/1778:47-1360(+)
MELTQRDKDAHATPYQPLPGATHKSMSCWSCSMIFLLIFSICSFILFLVFLALYVSSTNHHAPPQAFPFKTVLDYFSPDFTTCDAKFTQLCKQRNGTDLSYFFHPLRGPKDERLRAAVCLIGSPDAPNVFYVQSGTHGIEGYLGSAVQLGLLDRPELMPLEPNTSALLVHLYQPWGTAWGTKENEGNVDQLKNDEALYTWPPVWNNTLFEAWNDAVNIPSLGTEQGRQAALQRVGAFMQRHGPAAIEHALVLGQATRPKSLTYTGQAATWSKGVLDTIMRRYLARARRVYIVSLHTAVGPYGGSWPMYQTEPGQPAHEELLRWIPGIHPFMLPLPGPGWEFVRRMHPGLEVIPMVIEAGTYPQDLQMGLVFAVDQYCRHYAKSLDTPLCKQIKAKYTEFFYPQAAEWRQWAFGNVTHTLGQGLCGFQQYCRSRDASV